MNAARTVLLVLVCAAAIAGSILFFGSDAAPFEEHDRFLVGTWSKGNVSLDLAEDGRYALVLGSSGAPVECGKWRMVGGSLQMRAKKTASITSTLLQSQPGFRAGAVEHETQPPETITLSLIEARPANEVIRWKLRRVESPILPRCD